MTNLQQEQLLFRLTSVSQPAIHVSTSSLYLSNHPSTSAVLKPPPPSPMTPPLPLSRFPRYSSMTSLPSMVTDGVECEDVVLENIVDDDDDDDDEEDDDTATQFECFAPPPYELDIDDNIVVVDNIPLRHCDDQASTLSLEIKSSSAMQLNVASVRYHPPSQLEHVALSSSPSASSSYLQRPQHPPFLQQKFENPQILSTKARFNHLRRQSSPLICTLPSFNRNTPVETPSVQVVNFPVTMPSTTTAIAANGGSKEKRIGHRRVNDDGQVTYKGVKSVQIMHSIQLGIGYSIGSLASKPERDLLMRDFMEVETVQFPKSGSQTTPAHHYTDFIFSTYTPIAFRYFRDLFRIQPDDFMLSVVNAPLKELPNSGASGSVFYRTLDDNFIIKTVERSEAKFLHKLMPGYYMNLSQNPHTLLPKFFGLYCYECTGKNIRIIVMNNLLPSRIKIHQKYDLKGSTFRRRANQTELKKLSPTYKDLDFIDHYYGSTSTDIIQLSSLNELLPLEYPTVDRSNFPTTGGILLESHIYEELIGTLHRDCRVLQSFEIMDYSLLVGVHNYDQSLQEMSNGVKSKFIPFDYDDDDRLPTGAIRAMNRKGERLLLFIGIIDILQSYRLVKKMEHTWKSLVYDGNAISVHRPDFYSKRFLDFITKQVFGCIPSPNQPNKSNVSDYYYRYSKNKQLRSYR